MRDGHRVLTIIRSFWKTIAAGVFWVSFIAYWLGIIYLPADIEGLPETYPEIFGPLSEWLRAMTREHLIIAYAAILTLWVVWTEIRPFAKSWLQDRGKSRDFVIVQSIYCEAFSVSSDSLLIEPTHNFYDNVFYLCVGNENDNGETLKSVQARVFFLGPPTVCRIKDTKAEAINIRHGEVAYFELGHLVSDNNIGVYCGDITIPRNDMQTYAHNIPRGHLSFEVSSVEKRSVYRLEYLETADNIWPLVVIISADDVKALRAVVNVGMSNSESPLSIGHIS